MSDQRSDGSEIQKRGGKPSDFDLLRHNLGMASVMEEFLASTYGPGGRAKLFRDSKGKPIPTTNGARMLDSLDGNHPIVRMLAASAKAQEEEWCDGTKLTSLMAIRLLRRAEELLDQGLRPPHIIDGYRIGKEFAVRRAEGLAMIARSKDEELLLNVARASLGTWIAGRQKEDLARAVVKAALHVAALSNSGWYCDRRDIHIFPMTGGGFSVELVEGYVLKRFPDYFKMPSRVKEARIALFDAAPIRGKAGIHAPRLRWIGDSKIMLKSPGEIEDYVEWGAEYTQDLVNGLKNVGANVVLCRLGISDYGHKLLADVGILGIRRIMKTRHMEAVARATGGSFIKDFRDVREEDLGRAALVEERHFGEGKYLVITGCANPKVVSLVILAPGEAIAEQYKEQAQKAIGAVASIIEDPRLVVGGSGIEMAVARHVRQEAHNVEGREQLAVEAFARALEDISAILAFNLGLKPMDALVELRRLHTQSPSYGLLAGFSEPVDLTHGPVLDPLALHLSAWERAVDVCQTILRVDDFHKTSGKFSKKDREPSEKDGKPDKKGKD